MYTGVVEFKSGKRLERSVRKEVEVEGSGCVGMRISFFMLARRPRWEGEDTKVLNAS